MAALLRFPLPAVKQNPEHVIGCKSFTIATIQQGLWRRAEFTFARPAFNLMTEKAM